jgi:hypothetical protein
LRGPSLHQVDWEWKHDRRASFARDLEQRGEIAQLHRLRHRGQNLRSLEQLLRRLLLAFGVDDLGPAATLGFSLAGDRTDHAVIEVDALDLNVGDLDTPGISLFVEHILDVDVELVSLGEHLIEVVLAQYGTQRGLSWLVASM